MAGLLRKSPQAGKSVRWRIGSGCALLTAAVALTLTWSLSRAKSSPLETQGAAVEFPLHLKAVGDELPASLARRWPRGQIHKDLYNQHLSLHAFHGLKGPILTGISDILGGTKSSREKQTVVICGLEYGEEAELYASTGFRTIVFEPLVAWADKFLERVSKDVPRNIELHKLGAAVQRRYGTLEYQGKSEGVVFDPLDSHVAEHVLLMALDTQGTEYEILLGAEKLLTKYGVDILEIEVVMEERDADGGPVHIEKMLTLLDRLGYALFDFAWWGSRYNATSLEDCIPDAKKDAPSHCYYYGPRGTSIPDYVRDMHRVQRSRFSWMQTDILAIKRSLFSRGDLAGFIDHMSGLCEHSPGTCALREVLGEP